MKIDLTKLVQLQPQPVVDDKAERLHEPTVVDRVKRRAEYERKLAIPGTRPWGGGQFSYAPEQGLLWQGDYGVNPPDESIARLEGAGFRYKDGKCWRLLGTLGKRPSEIDKRRINDFIEHFGFDFRLLATQTS